MTNTERPQPGEFVPHAKTYVDHVPSGDVVQHLATQLDRTVALLRPVDDQHASSSYAPGKWTLKQAIGHMSDTERILSYRILRIARADPTPLPGFEQDDYVPHSNSNSRSVEDLVDEFVAVRKSTLSLIRSLDSQAWSRRGTVSGFPVSVRGLIFTLTGHELHHFEILRTRYLASR